MIDSENLLYNFREKLTSDLLLQVALFLFWVVVILLLTWVIRKAINRGISEQVTRYRARKAVRLFGYALIVLLAIITFTSKVQYFTVAIGLISAGVAFALQEVILSVAGWFAIYGSHYYKTGDRIEMNGVKGDVIDISVTKTTLMEMGEWVKGDNYSGRIVQLSNASVFKGPVYNYSTDFPFVWDEIDIPIQYGADLELAKKVILETAKVKLADYSNYATDHWKQMVSKYLIENANVEPTLGMKLTDNWMEFNLRYVVDFKKRRTTKTELFRDIYQAIENSEGKIKLASATLAITELPSMHVNVSKKE